MKKWIISTLALVGVGLVAALATTIRGAPASQERVLSDTLFVPVHVTVTSSQTGVVVGGQRFESGEYLSPEVPIRFRSAKKMALLIEDGREDYSGDDQFLCVMDHSPPAHGSLQEIKVISNEQVTLCLGIYQYPSMTADSTEKCVVCPYSERRVCGSRPQCME